MAPTSVVKRWVACGCGRCWLDWRSYICAMGKTEQRDSSKLASRCGPRACADVLMHAEHTACSAHTYTHAYMQGGRCAHNNRPRVVGERGDHLRAGNPDDLRGPGRRGPRVHRGLSPYSCISASHQACSVSEFACVMRHASAEINGMKRAGTPSRALCFGTHSHPAGRH